MSINEISCIDLKKRLDGGGEIVIIDVRESDELVISKLDNAIHIPLQDIPVKLASLDKDKEYAVLCRAGVRSAHATQYMIDQGFKHVFNIVGGINQWAIDINPNLKIF